MPERLDAELKQALLARDTGRVDVLKMLKSAALLAEKEQGELTESGFYEVVRKQIKMREDAIVLYEKSGSTDNAAKEQGEVTVLSEFLPTQMSEDELTALINQIASDQSLSFEKQNMGRIIGAVSAEAGDSASKSDIAKIINTKIQG